MKWRFWGNRENDIERELRIHLELEPADQQGDGVPATVEPIHLGGHALACDSVGLAIQSERWDASFSSKWIS